MSKTEIIYIGAEIDEHLFDKFILAIRKHKAVKFGKFGIFTLHEMKSRKGVNVQGKPVTIKAQNTVKFKPSDTVKRLVQKNQV